MNLSDLKVSKFLKKEDVGVGMLVTISSVTRENVAVEGAPAELKPCLHFEETDKPLVLNITNGQIIAKITGAEENIETEWIGHRIVLYNDPSVSYAGKLIGGIRARAPKATAPAAVKKQVQETDADCPF